MPSTSKSRLVCNKELIDRLSYIKPVVKVSPVLNKSVSNTKRIENTCINFEKKMEKEVKMLADEIQKLTVKRTQLLSHTDMVKNNLKSQLTEKEALLKECVEMKPDLFAFGKKKEVSFKEDTEYVLPFQVEDAKKRSALYDKVMKEFIKARNLNYKSISNFVDELNKNKILEELLELVRQSKKQKGRVYLQNRIKELKLEVTQNKNLADEMVKKTNENIGSCWERAANIYGPKMRELMERKGDLENNFLDKEERLKDLKTSEASLDKEIAAGKSKLERHTEINRQ